MTRRILATAALALAAVGLAASPASALTNVGAGGLTASLHYSSPIPPVGAGCASTHFSLAGSSDPFTLTTIETDPSVVVSGYAGPLTVTGSGGGSCESATTGAGSLTLSATGSTAVSCPSLTGSYTRAATSLVATVGGTCTVNGVASGVNFVLRGEFFPTNPGGGVLAPITDATVQGAIGAAPA